MAGSILGQDQIRKVNAAYAGIHAHVKALLTKTATPVERMRVHTLTEFLDTPELSKIFMELPFLAPAEKRALVRVAIFDVWEGREVEETELPNTDHAGVVKTAGAVPLAEFRPAQFNLNAAVAELPKPVVPPTAPTAAHTPIVQPKVQEQAKNNIATIEDHQGA